MKNNISKSKRQNGRFALYSTIGHLIKKFKSKTSAQMFVEKKTRVRGTSNISAVEGYILREGE